MLAIRCQGKGSFWRGKFGQAAACTRSLWLAGGVEGVA